MPELYFDDSKRNVIVMQDVVDREPVAKEAGLARTMDSFHRFYEPCISSGKEMKTVNIVESTLGAFFARLHSWGHANHGLLHSYCGETIEWTSQWHRCSCCHIFGKL